MKLPATWQKSRRVEVVITGRIQTRAQFEAACFVSHISDNDLAYRGIVDHPNGRMEWQWCKTLEEAKQWVDYTLGKYEPARPNRPK